VSLIRAALTELYTKGHYPYYVELAGGLREVRNTPLLLLASISSKGLHKYKECSEVSKKLRHYCYSIVTLC
jgi:hypothetical protein